jgi:hypothetical protein
MLTALLIHPVVGIATMLPAAVIVLLVLPQPRPVGAVRGGGRPRQRAADDPHREAVGPALGDPARRPVLPGAGVADRRCSGRATSS